MIINRTKLIRIGDKQFVDVYDYNIKKCKKHKEPLIVDVGEERMFIPYKSLSNYKEITPQKFKSKFGGQYYKLYTYEWKPETKEDEEKRMLL